MSMLRDALQRSASPVERLPDAQAWRRTYLFTADSAVFAGHFPDHPVLPAVTQLLMARMTLEEALGRPLTLRAVVQAKFTATLGPDAAVELRTMEGRRAGLWECELRGAGRLASRFQIELQAEGA